METVSEGTHPSPARPARTPGLSLDRPSGLPGLSQVLPRAGADPSPGTRMTKPFSSACEGKLVLFWGRKGGAEAGQNRAPRGRRLLMGLGKMGYNLAAVFQALSY